MAQVCFKTQVSGELEDVVVRVISALKAEGFGILTRIDLHSKFREKLQKDISPAVILGACNPQLAYDAYQVNSEVATLLPCNAVVREIAPGRQSVEFVRPSALMEILDDARLVHLAKDADARLSKVAVQLQKNQKAAA